MWILGKDAGAGNVKRILIAGEAGKTENYENAMQQLGACPVTALHAPNIAKYDGLILPGGGDIDPRLFGQLPRETKFFDPILDRIQLAILKAFVWERKPVLGICKGMQLINIFFGGDMFQNLASAKEHEYIGRDQVHETKARFQSQLYRLYGEKFVVNSAHHQGVDLPGQGITYTQFAKDGVVEGLEHDYLPVSGVQWHPERLCFQHKKENTVDGSIILRNFLKTT